MANNHQNAWAIFLIGIALLLWQGPKLGLFSLAGITDGYIFLGKNTISWTEPNSCSVISQDCTIGEQVPTTCNSKPTDSYWGACLEWYDSGEKDSYGCPIYKRENQQQCECTSSASSCIIKNCNECPHDVQKSGGMRFRECTAGNLNPGQLGLVTCFNDYWNWTRAYNHKYELCYDQPTQTSSRDDKVVFASTDDLHPTNNYCNGFFTTDGKWIANTKQQYYAPKSKNIRGQNFRTEYEFTSQPVYTGGQCDFAGGGDGSILIISGTGQTHTLYTWPGAPGGCNAPATKDIGLFEITPSVINPSIISVAVKGISAGTFDITGWPAVYLSATVTPGDFRTGPSKITLNNPRYQPLLSCVKEPDELLALESFSAGQELGIYSTRYAVQKFCLAHPVIVTSPTGSGTTAEPYQTWVEGRTLTVPQDQTWTVFYILKNDGSLPVTCGEDAYDVKLQKCTKVSGIIQICSQGQFDPALGVCVVQPESINICPEGGRYDVSLNLCVFSPPIQMICDQGTYDSVIGKCLFKPPSEPVCYPDATVYV